MGKWILGALALFLACVLVGNASSIWGRKGAPSLLAHRGLAQQFSREGLTNDTCTATRMTPPTHDYLENTLASMEAAFSLGAGMVELDIHPTTDGEFAVFHDWTLDCRTDGEGVTREQSMDYLRTLDIGHGYTADGGRTFPFRGRFKGAMPTLNEALDRFPNARFLVNLKSNDAGEADRLVDYLRARDLGRLSFYGAAAPIERMRALRADARLVSRRSIRRCLTDYLLIGWTGLAPASCRNTIVFVPLNYRLILWGWPNLLVERMARVNTDVYVVAPWRKGAFSSSIDRPEDLAAFVDGYAGGVSTDRIDILGPALTRSSEGGATPPPP